MGDKCRVAAGCIAGLVRAGLATYLILTEGFIQTMPAVMVFGVMGMIIACNIHSDTPCRAEVEGRKLTNSEARRCCARTYIYTLIILMNGCLIATFFMWSLGKMDLAIYIVTMVVCLILDIYCVKSSNFKYFCGSFYDTAEDWDDAYGVAPGGITMSTTAAYNNMQ